MLQFVKGLGFEKTTDPEDPLAYACYKVSE